MNRSEILDTAKKYVTKDRNQTHGKPEDTFGAIARVWSARLGVEITPAQVCILMADLKACRAWENPEHDDNWIDMAGYAACGGELAGGAVVGPCAMEVDLVGSSLRIAKPIVEAGTVWEAADGTTLMFERNLWRASQDLRCHVLVNGDKLKPGDELPYHKFILGTNYKEGKLDLRTEVKVRKVGTHGTA